MIYCVNMEYNKNLLKHNYNKFKRKIMYSFTFGTFIYLLGLCFNIFPAIIWSFIYFIFLLGLLGIFMDYKENYKNIFDFIKQDNFCFYDKNLGCVFNTKYNADKYFQIGAIGFNIKIVYNNIGKDTCLLDLNEGCLYL